MLNLEKVGNYINFRKNEKVMVWKRLKSEKNCIGLSNNKKVEKWYQFMNKWKNGKNLRKINEKWYKFMGKENC
jgi:hypothetical protein